MADREAKREAGRMDPNYSAKNLQGGFSWSPSEHRAAPAAPTKPVAAPKRGFLAWLKAFFSRPEEKSGPHEQPRSESAGEPGGEGERRRRRRRGGRGRNRGPGGPGPARPS